MRALIVLSALGLCGLATSAVGQAAFPRPRVAVVTVTLDEVRQIQSRHGRRALEALGGPQRGGFEFVEPVLAPELFAPCEDERADQDLDYCVRYYLSRADLPADAPPTVVVAFDDRAPGAPDRQGGEMRMTCYGRGVVAADPAAQDSWLWPGSVRVHGVNAWMRDREALAACIAAAASEPWTGLRQPDID
jgi:hypothetical protein